LTADVLSGFDTQHYPGSHPPGTKTEEGKPSQAGQTSQSWPKRLGYGAAILVGTGAVVGTCYWVKDGSNKTPDESIELGEYEGT
jgi:hypothetical protein